LLFWINNFGTNSEIGYFKEIDKIWDVDFFKKMHCMEK
jgi:hypothetical protein